MRVSFRWGSCKYLKTNGLISKVVIPKDLNTDMVKTKDLMSKVVIQKDLNIISGHLNHFQCNSVHNCDGGSLALVEPSLRA